MPAQQLDAYLDLLGVEFIGKLPSGKGKPPHNDAQVFLGAIGIKRISSSKFKFLSFHININLLFNLFSSLFPCIPSKILINNQPIINHNSFPINNDCHIDTIMPLPGVWHPNFEHVSKTHYLVTNFGNQNQCAIIHVGQIYQYIAFDNYICTNENNLRGYAGVSVRFCDFVLLYNSVASAPSKFSLYIPGTNGDNDMVAASFYPVTLQHFHITPQQCGLCNSRLSSHAQKLIIEQFAVDQARKSRIREEKFIDQKTKRQSLFGQTNTSYFDDILSLSAKTLNLLEFNLPHLLLQTHPLTNQNLLVMTDGLLRLTRTSHEPVPSAQIQGLPGALPPDPWLHPNISVGCTTS